MNENRNMILGIIAIGVLLALAMWAFAQANDGRDTMNNTTVINGTQTPTPTAMLTTSPSPTTSPASTASPSPQTGGIQQLNEITDNPDDFIGEQVTVQGEVDSVMSRSAIVLDVPGQATSDEILVITQTPISDTVANAEGVFGDKQARLTGTVNRFTYNTYRNTLGTDVTAAEVANYEGQPFILTNSITAVQ